MITLWYMATVVNCTRSWCSLIKGSTDNTGPTGKSLYKLKKMLLSLSSCLHPSVIHLSTCVVLQGASRSDRVQSEQCFRNDQEGAKLCLFIILIGIKINKYLLNIMLWFYDSYIILIFNYIDKKPFCHY